jgi:NAD-dependent deacetylase
MATDIVILTGAGISRESGLDTFRDPDGIWSTVNIEDVATPAAFQRNPTRVHEFYNARRRKLLSGAVHPNAAHFALAKLESLWTGKVLIITQNIDDLHERAGANNVLHMHGELLKSRCTACKVVAECIEDLYTTTKCPRCGVSGALRPDVVWFGEAIISTAAMDYALEHCNLFMAIGTSGTVYPAAAFVEEARHAGARTVELNLERTTGSVHFDQTLIGPATQIVPQYVEELLKTRQPA